MGLIYADYDKALAQANELEKLAEEFSYIIGNVYTITVNTENAWSGKARQAAVSAMGVWKDEMQADVTKMLSTAARIRTAVSELRAAEERAKAIAAEMF